MLTVFDVWDFRKETGLLQGVKEEESNRWEESERERKRKQSAVSHSGGKVEPLARILLAMSTIWNAESLPLSALRSNGVVLCLSAPSLCSDSTLEKPLETTPMQMGLFWQNTRQRTNTEHESESSEVARMQPDTL